MSNISVDYDVLNQRGSPAWFSDIYANIPTAGYKGRMFISTDTYAFYRDTGTGWDLIGGPGTGTITGSGATGQVSFFNGSSTLAGNNNLFWDNTNSRLGINTTTPGQPLDIHSTGNTLVQLNNTSTGNSNISFQNQNVSKWRVGNVYNAGANSFDIQNAGLSANAISISAANLITTSSIFCNTSLTSNGTFTANSNINITNGAGITVGAGYNVIASDSLGFFLVKSNSVNWAYLLLSNLTAPRNFTFPDTTGTIALTSNLSSYVPYTGATTSVDLGTFALSSNIVYVNGNSTTSVGGYLGIKQFASTQTGVTGYTSFSALNSNILYLSYSTGVGTSKYVQFDNTNITNNSGITLSFPSATGTLALTSDLSSYLPLTGGTLTGALVINPTNTLTIGLDVASNTTRFRSDNLEGNKRQLEITMGSGTLVQLVAKGYGANYGTDLAFYTATTGGTNTSPGIYITGTNNRVGIKTGTPSYDLDVAGTFGVSSAATFSSSVDATTFNSTSNAFRFSGSNALSLVTLNSQNVVKVNAAGYWGVQLVGANDQGILIGNTGNIGLGTTTPDQKLTIQANGTTNALIAFRDSGGTNQNFIGQGNAAGDIIASSSTNDLCIRTQGGNILFALSNIEFARFTPGGSLGLGVNPSYKLQLSTDSAAKPTTALWTIASDIRIKENINTYNLGLKELLQINPITYDYNGLGGFEKGRGGVGIIAQEIIKILPNSVNSIKNKLYETDEEETDILNFNGHELIYILINSIKELNQKLIKNNIN